MREIKFRAWDKANNNMLCSHEINGGWLLSNQFEHFIPMQFTGLKDKNGKEIYEGDILNFVFDGVIFISNPYYVVFESGAFLINKPNFKPLVSDCSNLEIVDNIYENPELIKQ